VSAGPSLTERIEQADEDTRTVLKEYNRRSARIWRSGPGGKVLLILLFLGVALPVLVELGAALYLWLKVLPDASGYLRWAVGGSILTLLLALSYTVSTGANRLLNALYALAGRKRRNRPKTPDLENKP
jgi:hypothetical protein